MTSIIIDGNNLTLIAYAASLNSQYKGTEGEKLFIVLSSMIQSLKKKFSGDFYVCWDTFGGTSFRKELDSNYKAGRDHDRFDFEEVEKCKNLYELYGIKSLSIPECEADDAIFVLCKALGGENIIISADKDLIQVVQEGYASKLYDPRRGKGEVEIPPYSIVKYKALVGDNSDHISGVVGIGPKKALFILDGSIKLTEEQNRQYEHCINLVDAKRNPKLQENYNFVLNYLKEIGITPEVKLDF